MNKPSYDANQIAQELIDTASGQAYHGNALKVALDIPLINSSPEYKAVIQRYLRGSGAIESGDHITLQEAALLIRGSVKPRCPWPVHQWHPDAAYCSNYCGNRFRLFDKDDYCVEVRYFETTIETQWTRAEALASQMLDKPDKVGVWAIYSDGIHFRSNYFSDITVDYIDTSEDEIGYPNKRMEVVDSRGGYYTLGAFQFYYMGPLPTAESEVPNE